nr:hypothetical protein [Variovorax boronicumulans]
MQDDNFPNGRETQDQYGTDERQRVLRAQQEAREREQLEQDEDDERARHRFPGARPGAAHALHADQADASPSRSSATPGAQKGGRSRVLLLGAALVAALAFAGYKYMRSPGSQMAAAPGSESPLTAGLPPVFDEPTRTGPAGPALPSAPPETAQPAAAAQPAQADAGNLLAQVSTSTTAQAVAVSTPASATGAAGQAPAAAGAGELPAAAGAGPALQERVQTVEALVQELREQMARLEGQQAELTAKAAAPRPASRPRPVSRPVAAAPVAPEPAAPKLPGRLLAVDSWGGVPSVIVGTGIPGDKRTRVLRPGDTYNGVSLVEANRARGEATFIADGKQFRLTLQDGE